MEQKQAQATPPPTIQKPWSLGVFSGNTLKYFAAVLMVCDHLHQFFFQGVTQADWLNWLGRPVKPIFLFMCAEGFYHTRSKFRYALKLYIGSCIMSTINLMLPTLKDGTFMVNNIFSTMCVSVLYMWFYQMVVTGIKEKKTVKILGGIGLAVLLYLPVILFNYLWIPMTSAVDIALNFIPNAMRIEGGFVMVALAVAFYALRSNRLLQMLPLVLISIIIFITEQGGGGHIAWMMIFAVIPLLLYNSKRGAGGNFSKYFFYIFYPAHLYVIYFIALALQ